MKLIGWIKTLENGIIRYIVMIKVSYPDSRPRATVQEISWNKHPLRIPASDLRYGISGGGIIRFVGSPGGWCMDTLESP